MGCTEDGYAKLEELTTKFPEQRMAVAVAQEKLKERPKGIAESPRDEQVNQLREEELAARRDETLERGDLLGACRYEMSRVRLRTQIGHPYKDKIDLAGLYKEYVRRFIPTDEQKRALLPEVERCERRGAEQEFPWRWHHLASTIYDDLGDKQNAMKALDAALDAYPLVHYDDASKQSMYHHLVNQRAAWVWDEQGVEAAENYFLGRLANDPKCEFFFETWWKQRYKEAQSLERLDAFKSKVLAAYEARRKAGLSGQAEAEKPQAGEWFLAGSIPQAYEMGVDEAVKYRDAKVTGREVPARYLKSVEPNPQGFATMMQLASAKDLRGKRVRLSGDVKSEDVSEWAGIWMRIDGPNKEILAFDNMAGRPVKGSTDWTHYEIVLDVAENAETLACGILLTGPGTVWLANMDAHW